MKNTIIETIKSILFIAILIFTFYSNTYVVWLLLAKLNFFAGKQSIAIIIVIIAYWFCFSLIKKRLDIKI